MKIKEKELKWRSGYIWFDKFEISWCTSFWALPLSIDVTRYAVHIQFLMFSFCGVKGFWKKGKKL